ncbi:hypothetical protein, partial [Fulvivirga aurantia]|uniref:hypothetical protein n=1 Tax=Fulvivirga aurantia TaxID=2529383 RepID=UPI001625100D
KKHAIIIIKVTTPTDPSDPDYIHNDIELWKLLGETDDNSGGRFSFEIKFFAFKDTISPNEDYIVSQLHLPSIFFGEKSKYKYAGLFLLKPSDTDWLKTSSQDHGQYGCPIPVDPPSSQKSEIYSGPASFTFNNNYY